MNTVLSISKHSKTTDIVRELLTPFNLSVISQNNSQNFMLNIYQPSIKLIIVDIKGCDFTTLELINTVKIKEFVPVIAIGSINSIDSSLKFDYSCIISENELPSMLPQLVRGFLDSKNRYDQLRECYNTVNSINSKTDELFKISMYRHNINYMNSLEELMDNAFISNKLLKNKPSIILISFKNNDATSISIYRYTGDNLIKDDSNILLHPEQGFGINFSAGTELYRNFDDDAPAYYENDIFLDERIVSQIHSINNFVVYNTTDTAVIALNYHRNVTHYDANIIKGLCININLIKNIYNQINELNNSFEYTANALARAAEAADDETGTHIRRVNEYSRLIAESLGMDNRFTNSISIYAQMHDVGKIHVPVRILKKPDKLTNEEFSIMKQHTVYGAKIIGDSPNLKIASEIALSHHEKYDGSGYPYGKKGEDIPLSARIVAIADIYDALRSRRAYKAAFDHQKTHEIIVKGDGRVDPCHFDPEVLNIFIKNHKKFNEINEYFALE